jgi:TRAP transporter TAXI family solute receptor
MLKIVQSFLSRDFWSTILPVLAILLGTAWLAYQFVQPAPPRKVVMTSGAEGGAYESFATEFRDILARDGIEVELRPSAGSVDNLNRLKDEASGVSIGFVQGGIAKSEDGTNLMSLASLYYEPLWVFYRNGPELDRMRSFRGKRVAIGSEGSGTRALSLQVLKLAGLDQTNTTFLALGATAAADALIKGDIDAAIVIGSPESPVVHKFMHSRNVQLMNFSHAEAYTRHLPFLSHVVLPKGGIDLVDDIPARDVHLVAPTANLVVRDDIHPALVSLLMQAATEVHGDAGMLQKAGEFPSSKYLDIPQSLDARRYIKDGQPFLQRHLPFWMAVLFDRLVVMLIPILAVLIPMFKLAPAAYAWRIKSRIYRWYGKLKVLEVDMERAEKAADIRALQERLNVIEQSVTRIPTPLAYSDYLYNLRSHIDLVRAKLLKREESTT